MARSSRPGVPARSEPVSWEHYDLWKRAREALFALPAHFETTTNIEGMLASDIFTLNAALGATIEEQVVATLNKLRTVWDPDKIYQAYSFVRQSQTFPDVLLRKRTDGLDILLGIELKGWYILAKEGEPNFRFTASPSACHSWDLIAVVPWVLSNVLAGKPVAYAPFVELARYAAEQRNYYWQHVREARGSRNIILATGVVPYPTKGVQISDRAESDSGGNYGRIARYGVMEEYVQATMQTMIRGVSAKDWLTFFKQHARESSG